MRDDAIRYLFAAALFSLALVGVSMLSGCATVLECLARDGTSRPCH